MNLEEEFGRDELQLMDIKNLVWHNIYGLSWEWTRGAKTDRYYTVNRSETVTDRRVKVSWSYIMDAGNRNIVTPSRELVFYKEDGVTPFLGPQDISKPFNLVELDSLNMDVRIKRIANLRKNAELVAGGQALIDNIYSWYGSEISHYESPEGGSDTQFEDALKNETDPARLAVLNYQIPEFGNTTITQQLAYQLVGTYNW